MAELRSNLHNMQFGKDFIAEEPATIHKRHSKEFIAEELKTFCKLQPKVEEVDNFIQKLRKRHDA